MKCIKKWTSLAILLQKHPKLQINLEMEGICYRQQGLFMVKRLRRPQKAMEWRDFTVITMLWAQRATHQSILEQRDHSDYRYTQDCHDQNPDLLLYHLLTLRTGEPGSYSYPDFVCLDQTLMKFFQFFPCLFPETPGHCLLSMNVF